VKKIFVLVILSLIVVSCGPDDIGADNEILVPVSVEEIKLGSIEEFVEATGTVQSTKEATIRSEINGEYKLLVNPKTGRLFALGDRVNEGQKIIKLEDPEYENTIRIDLKKLQLEQAKEEYEKQKSLYEKGGVTQRELKTAELNYLNEEYIYENAEIQLKKMEVVAPFDGIITELPYYTPGVKINQGLPVVRIMNYETLYLEVNLPEKLLGEIKENQTARVMNYTMEDDTLKGVVKQISPTIDSGTRTFKAAMNVQNTEWKMRPGMFVKVELVVARKDSAIVIPKDIILSRQRGKTVFVIVKGASQQRVISTGLENPESVEVLSGLEVDERLVVKGYETLRSRQKVKIIR
jgi:membrane fusion protein (multidrug efflux system)